MPVIVKHFWVLESKVVTELVAQIKSGGKPSKILRQAKLFDTFIVKFKDRKDVELLINMCKTALNVSSYRELEELIFLFFGLKKRLQVDQFNRWAREKFLPLWAVKLLGVLFAVSLKRNPKEILPLVIEWENGSEKNVPGTRQIKDRYFNFMFHTEKLIDEFFTPGHKASVKNPFPLELDKNLAVILARFIFSTKQKTEEERLYTSRYPAVRKYYLSLLKGVFGGTNNLERGENLYLNRAVCRVLLCCFSTLVEKKIPSEIFSAEEDVKLAFVGALFDECAIIQWRKLRPECVEFRTNKPHLLDDLKELLAQQPFGYRVGDVSIRETKYVKLGPEFRKLFILNLRKYSEIMPGFDYPENLLKEWETFAAVPAKIFQDLCHFLAYEVPVEVLKIDIDPRKGCIQTPLGLEIFCEENYTKHVKFVSYKTHTLRIRSSDTPRFIAQVGNYVIGKRSGLLKAEESLRR